MKVGLGRALVSLGLLVGAQAVAGQKPAADEPTVTFVLELDGGVAYVFSDTGGRVDVGPIAMPAGAAAASFTRHPMTIVTSGEAQKPPDWPLQPHTAESKTRWALEGYEVWPCPDGVCPSTSTLAVSPDRGPDPSHPCRPPNRASSDLSIAAVDNLYYLPNLLELHPEVGLPADWHRRLEGRLVLKAGKLIVVHTFNCVELRSPTVNRRQAVTNGMSGVHYVVPVRQYVDLLFKQPGSGAITGAIRLVPAPNGREIRAHLEMPFEPESKHLAEGQSLPEYQQFYELLPGVPAGGRIDARFQPEGFPPPRMSPGQECGSVRFGAPPAVTSEAR